MLSTNGADEAALEISYTDAPAINVAMAEQLLLEAKEIMNTLDVPIFLRQGTCLGAIRNNALISWDDDIDIGSIHGLNGLDDQKIESVAAEFRENGFYAKVEYSDQYVSVTMMKSSIRIDWNCYKIIDEIIFHYPGVRIPARLFENPKEIDFIGSTFFVPNPPEEYLRFKYGENWKTPKQDGFEQDVLALIDDGPALSNIDKVKQFFGKNHLRQNAGNLQVLNHENIPVENAEVRIVAVGSYRTNKQGYAKIHLPKDDWYALVIKHDTHEEVLYQEKLSQGKDYVYKPDPSANSGRLCVLSSVLS